MPCFHSADSFSFLMDGILHNLLANAICQNGPTLEVVYCGVDPDGPRRCRKVRKRWRCLRKISSHLAKHRLIVRGNSWSPSKSVSQSIKPVSLFLALADMSFHGPPDSLRRRREKTFSVFSSLASGLIFGLASCLACGPVFPTAHQRTNDSLNPRQRHPENVLVFSGLASLA